MNLRDVITFQGSSVQELKKALADSVEDYIASCKERGEEPAGPTPIERAPSIPPSAKSLL